MLFCLLRLPRVDPMLSMVLLWISLPAYAGSLALPAYLTDTDAPGRSLEHYGLEAFLLEPIGVVDGQISWLANPLLLVSWVRRAQARPWASFFLAIIALCPSGHPQMRRACGSRLYRALSGCLSAPSPASPKNRGGVSTNAGPAGGPSRVHHECAPGLVDTRDRCNSPPSLRTGAPAHRISRRPKRGV